MLVWRGMLGLSAGRTGCHTSCLSRSWPHPKPTGGSPAPSPRATPHASLHSHTASKSIKESTAATFGSSNGEADRGGQMAGHPATGAHGEAAATAAASIDIPSHQTPSPQQAQQETAKQIASQQRKRQQRQDRLADSVGPPLPAAPGAPDPAYQYPLPLTTLEVSITDHPRPTCITAPCISTQQFYALHPCLPARNRASMQTCTGRQATGPGW